MRLTSSFIAGTLFAIGLAIAGMTEPDNIIGFLDFFGDWKAELMFVMGGAVITLAVVKRFTASQRHPVFDVKFRIPTRRDVNPALVGGAAMFGIGWGLGGLCPGPAIASLATFEPDVLIFIAAMALGMTAHTKLERHLEKGN